VPGCQNRGGCRDDNKRQRPETPLVVSCEVVPLIPTWCSPFDPHVRLVVSPQLDCKASSVKPRPLSGRGDRVSGGPTRCEALRQLTASLAERYDVLFLLQPRIHHVDNVRDGQPGLGDIGRDDNLALVIRGRVEHLTLFDVGQVAVQRSGEDLSRYSRLSVSTHGRYRITKSNSPRRFPVGVVCCTALNS